jgi:hypothetical protein
MADAGTVTATEVTYASVKKVTFDWLSTSLGVAEKTTTNVFDGQLLGVLFIPDTGDTAPTDQYDVTLADADSRDLLFGQGANLSGTLSVAVLSSLGQVSKQKLTCAVAGAGDSNGGIVVAYVR